MNRPPVFSMCNGQLVWPAGVETSADKVAAWNARYPIGTAIRVRRSHGRNDPSTTESEAYISCSGKARIYLWGMSGSYLLDRVFPLEAVL